MQFDSQIQSTVPNGVAPFAVASNELVVNLNANFLNGFGSGDFALANHDHTSSQITDSTAAGRTLLTSLNAGTQRADLGLMTRATTISAVASVNVSREEDPIGTPRPGIRFLEGSGVSISVSNDDAEDRYDVTISATATGGSGNGNTRSATTLNSGLGDSITLDETHSVVGVGPLTANMTITLPTWPTPGHMFTIINRAAVWDVLVYDGAITHTVQPGKYIDLIYLPLSSYYSFGIKTP